MRVRLGPDPHGPGRGVARTDLAAARCGSRPRLAGNAGQAEGRWSLPEAPGRRSRRPAARLGGRAARSLRRPQPRGGRRSKPPRPAGASWPRCWLAPSGGARSAAATSSRGSPASSMPPRTPPPSSSGSPAALPRGRARRVVPVFLVPAVNPANLYGAGAPLDVELLDGGSARLPRVAGHFLAIRDGRPVLIVESYGQTPDRAALGLAGRHRFRTEASPHLNRIRVNASSRWNCIMACPRRSAPAAARLAELGFVRDYPGMAYYAGLGGTRRSALLDREIQIVGPHACRRGRPSAETSRRRRTRSPAMDTGFEPRPRAPAGACPTMIASSSATCTSAATSARRSSSRSS